MTLESIRHLARAFSKVSDKTISRPPDVNEEETGCLQSAIDEYSRVKPLEGQSTLTAIGTLEYLLPTWWTAAHTLRTLRHRIDERRRIVDERDWLVYQDGNDWVLRVGDRFDQGLLQFDYFGPHQVDDSSSTIPAPDLTPLAHLAAYYLLTTAANNLAKNANTSVSGDAVSQNEQSKAYSYQAKDEWAHWERFLGTRTGRSTRLNWDLRSTEHNGLGRFWNRRGRIGLW